MADTNKRVVWDQEGQHFYETGCDRGVLYVYDASTKKYGKGVAWSGLTSVSNDPDGADPNDFYADNIKYASVRGAENFGGSIGCYTYPREFRACNGELSIGGAHFGQQTRKTFAFTYRTGIGSDTIAAGDEYKIHIVYGCTCSPSSTDYESVNDSPDAMELEFEYETTPVSVTGQYALKESANTPLVIKPLAHVEFSTVDFNVTGTDDEGKEFFKWLEDTLYGTDGAEATDPKVPTLDEIFEELVEKGFLSTYAQS